MKISAAAPHYPVLQAIIRGMKPNLVLEFGCGGSTIAMLEALAGHSGHLTTVDRRPIDKTNSGIENTEWPDSDFWSYHEMTSEDYFLNKYAGAMFGFIFHDGAHDYETVKFDLCNAVHYLNEGGIIAVHDTDMDSVEEAVFDVLFEIECEEFKLPYAQGLTLIKPI
jgi:predicted O-methyltransferase YrrM